ncbi:MAG: hypothetical protein R3C01_07565 [Planctomycetaceae bacterium]
MTIAPLIHEDTSQLFADWSVPLILRQEISDYDPSTGQIVMTCSEVTVDAVVGPNANQPSPHSATAHRDVEQTFLIRESAFPNGFSISNTLVVHGSMTFRIRAATRSPITGLTLLHVIAK